MSESRLERVENDLRDMRTEIGTKIDNIGDTISHLTSKVTDNLARMDERVSTNTKDLDSLHKKHRECEQAIKVELEEVARLKARSKVFDLVWKGLVAISTVTAGIAALLVLFK